MRVSSRKRNAFPEQNEKALAYVKNEAPPRKRARRIREQPKNSVHIHQLPGPIMSKILAQLHPMELISVERVCRRWRHIAKNYSWNNLQTLSACTLLPQFSGQGNIRFCKMDSVIKKIELIVNRAGKYLNSINLSQVGPLDHNICKFLPRTSNVSKLDFAGIPLTNSSLGSIGRYLPGLREVSFKRCFDRTQLERGLSRFLEDCQSLESLDISDNEYLSGQTCFSGLPSTLTHLRVSHCYRINPKAIAHIRDNCPNLKSLHMDRIDGISSVDLNRLFEAIPRLEVLHFGDRFNGPLSSDELISLGSLKQLRTLVLYDNSLVTDALMKSIGYGCKNIVKLDISGANRRLTDQGLKYLCNLPKLSILNLSGMKILSDETLIAVAANGTLEELLIHRCAKVTDESVLAVLKRCKLRALDISYCQSVTDATLNQIRENLDVQYAGQIATAEDDGKKFKLWMKRSGINPHMYIKHDWLKIMHDSDHEIWTIGHIPALLHLHNIVTLPLFHF
ncbi:f-box-like domain-containing protein [Ditylenchus destructor]|uniref:F-box-like domain-containing protein n=1 Tax=Ditylenchus destructor TaxID=166010 RepID=A0AAD4NB82_9BILA|nr:f-box-like domain-containing protein [Ditylenchus destructor]